MRTHTRTQTATHTPTPTHYSEGEISSRKEEGSPGASVDDQRRDTSGSVVCCVLVLDGEECAGCWGVRWVTETKLIMRRRDSKKSVSPGPCG